AIASRSNPATRPDETIATPGHQQPKRLPSVETYVDRGSRTRTYRALTVTPSQNKDRIPLFVVLSPTSREISLISNQVQQYTPCMPHQPMLIQKDPLPLPKSQMPTQQRDGKTRLSQCTTNVSRHIIRPFYRMNEKRIT